MKKYFMYSLLSLTILTATCTKNKLTDKTLFTRLTKNETGITFQNNIKETDDMNVLNYAYLYNGGGVAIGDINNDGLQDILLTGNMTSSRLFLNKGNLKFEDISSVAGIVTEGWSSGATMADVNNDGWLDIYICRSTAADPHLRRNLLFINEKNGHFTEKAVEFGIADEGYSTQANFFDYDRDGDLDLLVVNHSLQTFTKAGISFGSMRQQTNPLVGNRLYKNENNKFTEISHTAGIRSNVLTFSLAAGVADINMDGWLNIYIGNDFNEHDYLYINQKNGTFVEQSADYFQHVSHFTMGLDIADFNNDCLPDIFTLDMLPESHYDQKMAAGPDNYDKIMLLEQAGFHPQTMRNMLQLNQDKGHFSEIGQIAGVSNTYWSWAALFADFDNDGWKDLFVSNGYKRDYTNMDVLAFNVDQQTQRTQTADPRAAMQTLLQKMPAIEVPNYLFQNNKNLTFQNVTQQWGLSRKDLSNGAAFADLDNDGDLDLIINNIDEPSEIYRNNAQEQTKNNFLDLQFVNENEAIGAKIFLTTPTTPPQYLEVMPSRGYQSSVGTRAHFGLGQDSSLQRFKIVWLDGTIQIFENIAPNQCLKIQKDKQTIIQTKIIAENFKNIFLPNLLNNDLNNFKHIENFTQDFKVDFLLPWMLSTLSPKLAVGDINGDKLEDFWVGGSHQSAGKIFVQQNNGTFAGLPQKALEADKECEDLDAIFFDADGDKDLDLYVTSGGNEFENNALQLRHRLYMNDGKGNFSHENGRLPTFLVSGMSAKTADFDKDGDLDLFVGGRLLAGAYPTAPRSFLLVNNGKGFFEDKTAQLAPELLNIGMVCDALWADVDNDSWQDLVVVGEWLPLCIFSNRNGKLQRHPPSVTAGFWNTVEAADFDNDNDLDLVIGNIGLNTQMKASENQPISIASADFDGNGSLDPIMSYFIGNQSFPMPSRDDIVGQLPFLKKRFLKYDAYAKATLNDLFDASQLQKAHHLAVQTTETTYFENDGHGNFTPRKLPIEAQFAPIHAIAVADLNGDKHLDMVLAGNQWRNRIKFGRIDANFGLVLLGDGKGHFSAVQQSQTGLYLKSEVRDMAFIKVGQKNQLLIAQNNDFLKLFSY